MISLGKRVAIAAAVALLAMPGAALAQSGAQVFLLG